MFHFLLSDESLHGEDASILRSLTGKRKLDSVGNDVQIWELSPSTSPLPKRYGYHHEPERFSFFSHSPIENLEKGPSPAPAVENKGKGAMAKGPSPSPSPNITEALMDLKAKSSMRLLGQLDAIVNRNNSRIFGMDGGPLTEDDLDLDQDGGEENGRHPRVPVEEIGRAHV